MMKNIIYACITVATVSFVLGLVSRVTLTPFQLGLVANSFLRFTNTCLLFAIALSAVKLLNSKS